MYLLRLIAKECGVETIYAVSDEGFYANTHLIRIHRAKVAELDSFMARKVVANFHKILDFTKFHWKNIASQLKKSNHKNVVNTENAMNYLINIWYKFMKI